MSRTTPASQDQGQALIARVLRAHPLPFAIALALGVAAGVLDLACSFCRAARRQLPSPAQAWAGLRRDSEHPGRNCRISR